MARVVGRKRPVKDEVIDLLGSGPIRYSEIVKSLNRHDKVIWQALGALQGEGRVRKRSDGLYELVRDDKNAEELARIEGSKLPASTTIIKAALQSKKELDVRTLVMAYELLLFVAKAAAGAKEPKLKKIYLEAADLLGKVKGSLDTRSPNWVDDYLKSSGKETEEALGKYPEGLPYSLPLAATAHSLATALNLLEKDLPKSASNDYLLEARKLAEDEYTELMREVLVEELASK